MAPEQHPDDGLLLAAAEGEVDGDVDSHLAGCEDCRSRIADYKSARNLIINASPVSRTYCPQPEDLVAEASQLAGERVMARDAHVHACPLCREDLADYAALVAEPDPTWVETLQAKVVLAIEAAGQAIRMLESTLTPQLNPQLAPARGESTTAPAVSVRIPFGSGELEVEWVAARGGVDLRVKAHGGAPLPYRVALTKEGGGVLESRTSDEAGQITLSGLNPGTYALEAYGPQRNEPDARIELAIQPPS